VAARLPQAVVLTDTTTVTADGISVRTKLVTLFKSVLVPNNAVFGFTDLMRKDVKYISGDIDGVLEVDGVLELVAEMLRLLVSDSDG